MPTNPLKLFPGTPELTIDAGALAGNYAQVAGLAKPAQCAANVKADAYGLGIESIVPVLLRAGCTTFFVAHLSEAARVRALSASATIYVLNGLPPRSAARYHDLKARPVLGSLEEIADWHAFGCGHPAALHVDTGLNRLGLSVEDCVQLVTFGRLAGLNLTLVLTHFVASEVPDDATNSRQIEAFGRICAALPDVPSSLSNSSGLFLRETQGVTQSLVRAGYAIYGGNPTPGHANPMQPVIKLTAPIVQLRDIKEGETVGYNHQWTALRPSRIATLSLGYGDGYDRRAGGTLGVTRGHARVRGKLCPLAGRVSMDLITVDVTDIARDQIQRGDQIALIDEVLTIDRVGEALGTIGYEVLTRLGQARARRIVIGGDQT